MNKQKVFHNFNRRSIQLFNAGIKPALLLSDRQLTHVNYIEKPLYRYKSNVLITNHAKDMKIFMDKAVNQKNGDKEFNWFYWLGITLGFPPNACEYFCRLRIDESARAEKVKVNYHGIEFTTSEATLTDNILWMKNRYTIPKKLRSNIRCTLSTGYWFIIN